MTRRWLQSGCLHTRLELHEITYNTPEITTTAKDRMIVCRTCGKVIVDASDYDRIKAIMCAARATSEKPEDGKR